MTLDDSSSVAISGWCLSVLTHPHSLLGLFLIWSIPPKQELWGPCSALQPWMQGLIAVAVFLVLVAIAFVVNRYWCQEKDESMESVVTIGNKPDPVVSNGHSRAF
uniref:PDZK1 interacting protein 1 n=1 Tax=Crocodylus porosus TaxID=8502 RepID=A0A7M4FKE3_CROPO